MKRVKTLVILILVIIILSFVVIKTIHFLAPILILLGALIACVIALGFVVKNLFKDKDDSTL